MPQKKDDSAMKTVNSILNNEDGYVIIVALLLLALVTIIGTTAIRTTSVELQIVRNDLAYRNHLYRAEAAAIQAAQWLMNSTRSVLEDFSSTTFISQSDINLTALDLNDDTWRMSGADPDQDADAIITGFRIVDETGPVDLSAQSNLHQYKIYGLYDRDRGQALVAIGFKKRF
jgi:Tfp pilus assembly protein PilX